MSTSVIDSKTQKHEFGVWPVKETVHVTMALVKTESGFGLNYDATYSGVHKGKTTGGPKAIPGDGTFIVNKEPKVEAVISQFSEDQGRVSMRVKISVDAPVIGTITVFDEVLAGAVA